MKKFIKIVIATAIFVTVPSFARPKYQLTPYAGYNFSDSDSEVKDSFLLGASLDTFLNDRYGIRLGFESVFNAKYKGYPSSVGVKDTNIYRYYANAIVNANDTFMTYFSMDPYLFGGVGYEDFDKACAGEEAQGFTDVGLGIRFPLSEGINVVTEAKAIQKWKSKDVDVVGNIGIGYTFDVPFEKSAKVTPPPPPKVEPQPKEEKIIIYNQFPSGMVQQVKPAKAVESGECVYADTVPKSKDICDNRNYIQVAAKLRCLPNEQYDNKKFLNKIKSYGYHYIIYNTVNSEGKRVSKVLIGPYRCFSDAKRDLCNVKKRVARDAFVFRKK